MVGLEDEIKRDRRTKKDQDGENTKEEEEKEKEIRSFKKFFITTIQVSFLPPT